MTKVYSLFFYISIITLLSCTPQKVEQGSDVNETHLQHQQSSQNPIRPNRLHIPIKALNVLTLPDYPVQVNIAVVVELKDSCTSVNEIYQKRRGDTFLIEMLESHQKQQNCKRQPTLSEYIIPLDIRQLSSGHYNVYVNQKYAHFELLVDNL